MRVPDFLKLHVSVADGALKCLHCLSHPFQTCAIFIFSALAEVLKLRNHQNPSLEMGWSRQGAIAL